MPRDLRLGVNYPEVWQHTSLSMIVSYLSPRVSLSCQNVLHCKVVGRTCLVMESFVFSIVCALVYRVCRICQKFESRMFSGLFECVHMSTLTQFVVAAARGEECSKLGYEGFRSGMATWMIARGDSLHSILAAGEWKSSAFARYVQMRIVDGARLFKRTLEDQPLKDS